MSTARSCQKMVALEAADQSCTGMQEGEAGFVSLLELRPVHCSLTG